MRVLQALLCAAGVSIMIMQLHEPDQQAGLRDFANVHTASNNVL